MQFSCLQLFIGEPWPLWSCVGSQQGLCHVHFDYCTSPYTCKKKHVILDLEKLKSNIDSKIDRNLKYIKSILFSNKKKVPKRYQVHKSKPSTFWQCCCHTSQVGEYLREEVVDFRYPGGRWLCFFWDCFYVWYWLVLVVTAVGFFLLYFLFLIHAQYIFISYRCMIYGFWHIYIIFEYEIGISLKICQPSCILEDFPPYDILPNHSIPWYQLLASGVCTAAVSFSKCMPCDYKRNGCWKNTWWNHSLHRKKHRSVEFDDLNLELETSM